LIVTPGLAATMGAESREIIRAYNPESAARGFASVVAALTGPTVREEVLPGIECMPKA
jgi:hypothetical protein